MACSACVMPSSGSLRAEETALVLADGLMFIAMRKEPFVEIVPLDPVAVRRRLRRGFGGQPGASRCPQVSWQSSRR